ncbi:hypothetical protein AVEN_228177-1 [Araneus ventricosus]|uniref:Uncharacterized protein n=1 Tax=Araneus ventricosus TaxID=182803 RepID=A0A4Y2CVF1_ARAVE|nr:hypothetical protein AVEN_228177-1 [Araneus ventricosus]
MFGTECFIHIPKQERRKSDKKAVKDYFVGDCGEKDGYSIWVPDKNDVSSRHVVFKDEITLEKTSIEIVQQKKSVKKMLVSKDFSQTPGTDYNETFSPVVRWDAIRTVLSVAAIEGLKLAPFDVKCAFMYGDLNEEIYMKQPQGYEDGTQRCAN